jgi:HAD superfamily hydrolase (TIGR01509 family)
MGLSAVIFDMDGTLVDSMHYHTLAWQQFLAAHGISASADEIKEKGHGTLFDIMPRFFGPHLTPQESYKLAMEKEAIFREIYAPYIKPLPGLVPLLQELKAAGIKIGLGTAADFTNTDFTIDALQIRHYFDVLVTSDLVHEGKPSPAVYNYAADRLGVSRTACLVFEDTFSGVEAAKAASMKVIAITTTHPREVWMSRPVEMAIDDYTQLQVSALKALMV